jgi:hypothetical protein
LAKEGIHEKLCLFLLLSAALISAQESKVLPASTPAASGTAATATPAPTTAATAAPATPVVEKAPAEQKMMLMFSAVDRDGNPIANVAKSQVSILDNGHLAKISDVQPMPDLPIDMGIVLLGRIDFSQQQSAAMELIKTLRPGKDRAFVIVAGGSKVLHDPPKWSSDQAELANEIKNLDKHSGYPDPFEYNLARNAAGLERHQTQEYSADTTSFFDFAWQNFTANPRFARRVLVIFRTPMGHAPGMSGRAKEAAQMRQMHVVQGSQFFRTPVFVVGIEDLGTYMSGPKDIGQISVPQNGGSGDAAAMRSRDREMQRVVESQYEGGRTNLNEIATDSGGRSFWTKKYTDAVASIKSDLTVPYVVSFVASAPAEVHSIKLSAGENVRVAVQQTVVQQMPK